jgi:hypothetical protein
MAGWRDSGWRGDSVNPQIQNSQLPGKFYESGCDPRCGRFTRQISLQLVLLGVHVRRFKDLFATSPDMWEFSMGSSQSYLAPAAFLSPRYARVRRHQTAAYWHGTMGKVGMAFGCYFHCGYMPMPMAIDTRSAASSWTSDVIGPG